ncbi:MAG: helix-turn-helix domain-containing protein [Erythrobacter sp.]|uniref:helix-turn-helix transcriptional regulator n=1 Tax=Erythrobacter sp. TaxID=1042 RepID=UPI0025E639A0|nr:helix-turn-helix transcriptional regulator [Erythrobacter sp.]MCL9998936.1 helix-turn-helix domain-containing protein [Erythrobacter sp.]
MLDGFQTFDLLLRGVAVGSQAALGITLARSAPHGSLKLATLLFILANSAFTLAGSEPVQRGLGDFLWALWLIQIGGTGYLWLFTLTLFEDHRLRLASFAPAIALVLIGLIAQFGPAPLTAGLWTAHNLIGLVLAVHAMAIIIRSGRHDLVEARRNLRVPFLLLIAGYSLLLSIAQIAQTMGVSADWFEAANAVIQAVLGLGGVGFLLTARGSLFGAALPPGAGAQADPALSAEELHWRARLDAVMDEGALWQREGLAIGDVAEAVGLPEHRLRRLINDQLGYRNFTAFINHRRIAAARAILEDPAQARRTVASIAFDLGFGSLGPFNRAFREATGVSPSEYRKHALVAAAPISEIPA